MKSPLGGAIEVLARGIAILILGAIVCLLTLPAVAVLLCIGKVANGIAIVCSWSGLLLLRPGRFVRDSCAVPWQREADAIKRSLDAPR